jgi:hypothetical protein
MGLGFRDRGVGHQDALGQRSGAYDGQLRNLADAERDVRQTSCCVQTEFLARR